jgi:hypothetical protein
MPSFPTRTLLLKVCFNGVVFGVNTPSQSIQFIQLADHQNRPLNMHETKPYPEEVSLWLSASQEETIVKDLCRSCSLGEGDAGELAKRLTSEDPEELLLEAGWSLPDRLGRPGDLTLVAIAECQDPLCGNMWSGLLLRKSDGVLSYIHCTGGESEGAPVLVTDSPLSVTALLKLLDTTDWLNSKVALESLDTTSEGFCITSILGGEWPLLAIQSVYPEIVQEFRSWVEKFCLKHRTLH